jgi:hypothetical protein
METKSYYNIHNGRVIDRPRELPGGITQPTDATLSAHGIYPCDPVPPLADGMSRRVVWTVIDGRAVPECCDVSQADLDAAAATQAAIDAGERLRGLAVQWGGLIAGLRAQLLTVGHDIPCDAAAVMGDLLTRTLRQQLTQAQGNAKGDIADIYNHLYASEVDALWAENWREHLRKLCVPTADELNLPISELENSGNTPPLV